MDQQQWTAYSESPGQARQARYAPSNMASPQHTQRDPNIPQHAKQDSYASPSAPLRQNTMPLQSPGVAHNRSAEYNDRDGDVPMEDADTFNKLKYSSSRAGHQNRHSQQFLQQEESAAARRYSPMNLSPTSPYSGTTQQGGQNYASFSPQTQNNRQSPTRNNPYMSSPNSYYSPPSTLTPGPALGTLGELDKLDTDPPTRTASRPHAPQLPPIQSNMSPESFYPQSATAQLNAVYSREARSPRATNSNPSQLLPIGRGPVPKMIKCTNTAELEPKINAQPPFRRANPEGGFISVCLVPRIRRFFR
jgi:dual specificity protein kinase YAK1